MTLASIGKTQAVVQYLELHHLSTIPPPICL